MLVGRKELDQTTEGKAQDELRSRAKAKCHVMLAEYAACMRLEGFMGPFRCKPELRKLNDCLHL